MLEKSIQNSKAPSVNCGVNCKHSYNTKVFTVQTHHDLKAMTNTYMQQESSSQYSLYYRKLNDHPFHKLI